MLGENPAGQSESNESFTARVTVIDNRSIRLGPERGTERERKRW